MVLINLYFYMLGIQKLSVGGGDKRMDSYWLNYHSNISIDFLKIIKI